MKKWKLIKKYLAATVLVISLTGCKSQDEVLDAENKQSAIIFDELETFEQDNESLGTKELIILKEKAEEVLETWKENELRINMVLKSEEQLVIGNAITLNYIYSKDSNSNFYELTYPGKESVYDGEQYQKITSTTFNRLYITEMHRLFDAGEYSKIVDNFILEDDYFFVINKEALSKSIPAPAKVYRDEICASFPEEIKVIDDFIIDDNSLNQKGENPDYIVAIQSNELSRRYVKQENLKIALLKQQTNSTIIQIKSGIKNEYSNIDVYPITIKSMYKMENKPFITDSSGNNFEHEYNKVSIVTVDEYISSVYGKTEQGISYQDLWINSKGYVPLDLTNNRFILPNEHECIVEESNNKTYVLK